MYIIFIEICLIYIHNIIIFCSKIIISNCLNYIYKSFYKFNML